MGAPREHVDLQALNTLALPAGARYFSAVDSEVQLAEAVAWAQARRLPLLVLGGGSNVVLCGEWPGLVLHMALRGRRVQRDGGSATLWAAAGENWHALVQWSLQQGLYGLENLTLIPGTAGAAPIQNIGAYGVELAHHLVAVRGWSLAEGRSVELSAAQCEFGYRDSIFKRALRGNFIITAIQLRLATVFTPVLEYPALREVLGGNTAPDALQVEAAVRFIRESRLPDPAQLPNAGSFFKNPVIDAAHFQRLRAAHPQLPHFDAADGVKIPAAWLVEQCGWKGRRRGAVGVHDRQALVLVHYPGSGGDGRDLLALAADIRADVERRFGVALELEPTVYGAQ